ncbi:NusG domain II-containing protein [uncultured Eubacterium sp.]|uniref:NusG domain II-containing protein n=1 Tax=uncultured Eubacterium sp. TaxID=165185 RepID=UPI002672773C|nr:NusG domain II-containing protein [uncultured Eubacterium sp.]
MKKYKADIVLIVILVIIAFISYIVIYNFMSKQGDVVEVYLEAKLIKKVPLDTDTEFEVKIDNHVNVVRVEKGFVFMLDADCPDKLCQKQGKIHNSGETIVCLPNKIVIRVNAEKQNSDAVDAKAQ